MASFTKYFNLMKEHPQLFINPDEEGVIKIITDHEKIRTLQAKLKKEYKESGKKN
ncbi:MAG: hypothetical protein JXA13_02770 [Anaerolineales bacterium]|nr:hypothetical protein [Anaerolineales bacterium]